MTKKRTLWLTTNGLRILLVGVCVCASRPSLASTISLTTTASAAISPGFFDQDTLSGALTSTTDVTLQSNALGSFNPSNLTSSLDVLASAFVHVIGGSLALGVNVNSSGMIDVGVGPIGSSGFTGIANSGLTVTDGLSIIGGPSSGVLALNFDISGLLDTETTSISASFATTAAVAATFNVNGQSLSRSINSQSGAGGTPSDSDSVLFPATWTVLLPYTNGSLGLSLHLSAQANAISTCSGVCTTDALGALGHTFLLSNIVVLDSFGQPIVGAYALGNSGIAYDNAPTSSPVPEPASLLLLGSGLVLVARRHRQRHRHD